MSRVNVQPNLTIPNPIPVIVNLVMDLQRILQRRTMKVLFFWLANTSPLLVLVNPLTLSGLSILVLVLISASTAIGSFPIPLSTLHVPLSLAINELFMQSAWVKLTL